MAADNSTMKYTIEFVENHGEQDEATVLYMESDSPLYLPNNGEIVTLVNVTPQNMGKGPHGKRYEVLYRSIWYSSRPLGGPMNILMYANEAIVYVKKVD